MTTVMGSPTRSCWIDLTHPIVVSPYFAIRPLEVDTMVSFITLAPNNFEWRQPITTPAVSENKTPPEVIERGLPASKSETSGAEPQPDSMQAGLDTGYRPPARRPRAAFRGIKGVPTSGSGNLAGYA